MMEINLDNYEAYFLDFVEGNLSDAESAALEAFLSKHPELRSELEEFVSYSDTATLSPDEKTSSDWSELKKPNSDDLDHIMFKSVEGTASETEKEKLNEALQSKEHQEQYEAWEKAKLDADTSVVMDGADNLYITTPQLPVTPANYDLFLWAYGEGDLNAEETAALEAYANAQDLNLSKNVKLAAPKGVFYPDKNKLYKKEKKVVVWWRIAAVLLIGLVATTIFLNRTTDPEAQYALRGERVDSTRKVVSEDTIAPRRIIEEEIVDTIAPIKKLSPPIEEWEVREPDPAFIAEEIGEAPSREEESTPEPIEVIDSTDTPQPILEDLPILTAEVPMETPAESPAKVEENDKYRTVPEITQDILAEQLNISDEERDQMALAVAKRVTDRAAAMLDSEVKREESESGEEMTYTLRIRNFKIQHKTRK